MRTQSSTLAATGHRSRPDPVAVGIDVEDAQLRFLKRWQSEGSSPKTLTTYGAAIDNLLAYLRSEGHPTDIGLITTDQIMDWQIAMQERGNAPGTISNRHRAVKTFFRWLVDPEGEIPASPMDRLDPPTVVVVPPTVLTDEEIARLRKVVRGRGFAQRRDRAIIEVLLSTGVRRAELIGMETDDVDWPRVGSIFIRHAKGGRPRHVYPSDAAGEALLAYRPERKKRRDANLSALWLGVKGPLGDTGLRQMLNRRAREAGLRPLNPHLFRHTWADRALRSGISEGDVMTLGGWREREMLSRYGASAAADRAAEAARRIRF